MDLLDNQMSQLTEQPRPDAAALRKFFSQVQILASHQDLSGLVQDILEFTREELDGKACALYLLEPEGWVCLAQLGDVSPFHDWLPQRPHRLPPQIQADSEGRLEVLTHQMGQFCLLAWGNVLTRAALPLLQALEVSVQSSLHRLCQISRLQAEISRTEQALNQRSAYLSGLSHQLRTPMNVMLGFTQLLSGDPETTTLQKESLTCIEANGLKLLDMVDEVVEMARLEAGQVVLTNEVFELYALLRELSTPLTSALGPAGRELNFPGNGSLTLLGDCERLGKLIGNVFRTTSRLNGRGRISLTIHLLPEQSLQLEILDEGARPERDQLEALFDPFSHAGQHHSDSTGLQLAIARQYASLMGGSIRVNIRPEGLLWTIRLQLPPAAAVESQEFPDAPDLEIPEVVLNPASVDLMELAGAVRLGDVAWVHSLLSELGRQMPEYEAFWKRCQELAGNFQFRSMASLLPVSDLVAVPADHRPTVLLVDDNPTNLNILYRALMVLECRCLVAQSGEECLRIARQTRPTVILLDVLMPGWDGFETLKRLRDDSRAESPSVIFLSALCDTSDKVRGLKQGASDYISKPFHPEEVVARVRLQLALRSLQDQLRERNQQLTKSNQQKNELLGMAAHDLRNPLAVITGYAAILERGLAGPLEEKPRSLIQNIHSTGKEMQVLLEDLLSVSQIESGHLHLHLAPVDPQALFEGCIHLQSFQAAAKNITLQSEVIEPIPAQIPLDASKMKQALTNLLSNAIKFSHPHTTIQARLLTRDNHLVWEVEDQGPGIPSQDLGRLFQPFQRASVRTTGGERSTGLGLAIIKRILEGHSGEIAVDSQVGRGSTFSLKIPLSNEGHLIQVPFGGTAWTAPSVPQQA